MNKQQRDLLVRQIDGIEDATDHCLRMNDACTAAGNAYASARQAGNLGADDDIAYDRAIDAHIMSIKSLRLLEEGLDLIIDFLHRGGMYGTDH